jgi:hypothetical protein
MLSVNPDLAKVLQQDRKRRMSRRWTDARSVRRTGR